MNENQQNLPESSLRENHQDEIEFIDILRVIWKWKLFIIAGTMACGLIAAVISHNITKIYSINMVLRPGILSIGRNGRNVYIDSPQNIKALIESKTFNNDILSYLNDSKVGNVPKQLNFKVTVPTKSDTIVVNYKTANIKQGIAIQNLLSKSLLNTYRKVIDYSKNEFDIKLNLLKTETNYIKGAVQSYKRYIKNLERQINELNSEIQTIKKNTSDLIKKKNKLLSGELKEKSILSVLFYTNTIQQSLQLSFNYQKQIIEYRSDKEDKIQKIEGSKNEMIKKLDEIKSLQFKKDSIQNIQILKGPTTKPYPVKPKTILNVAFALVAGFFFFFLLSFFLEYLQKQKNN